MVELVPLKAYDDVFEQEFKKGEIAGMRLFLTLPQTYADDLLYTLQRAAQDEKESDDAQE